MTTHTLSPYRFFGTFRFMLALAVAVSHFQESLTPEGVDVHEKILARTGIFLFFVLSGYVLAEALNLFYQGRLKQFLINRGLRIFPPFLVALAIGIFTYILFAHYSLPHLQLGYESSRVLSPKSIFGNIFSVFDFRIPKMEESYYLLVRMVWTLVIEWQFYVAFALICFAINKRQKQAYQEIILCVIGISSYLIFALNVPVLSGIIYRTTFQYFIYFLVGAWIYWILSERRLNRTSFVLAVVTLVLVTYDYSRDMSIAGVLIFLSGILCLGLLSQIMQNHFFNLRLKTIDALLGAISYPLYLNHFTVQLWFNAFTNERSWGIFAASLAIAVVTSYLAYLSVEPAVSRVRDRIRGMAL